MVSERRYGVVVMKKLAVISLLFSAISLPIHADPGDVGSMVPSAKNAVLPAARTNLGLGVGDTLELSRLIATYSTTTQILGTQLSAMYVGSALPAELQIPSRAGNGFYLSALIAMAQPGFGAILGVANNTYPTNLTLAPAITGWGVVPSTAVGNIVFGLYGLAELYAVTGGVSNEVTVRNYAGSIADISLPPHSGPWPLDHALVIGHQVTCGTPNSTTLTGNIDPKDCSIGTKVSNESGVFSEPQFYTGEYLQSFRQYGIFVADQPISAVSATIASAGSGGTNGTGRIVKTTTGGGTPAKFRVTIAGGAITSVQSLASSGALATIFTDNTQEPVTGDSANALIDWAGAGTGAVWAATGGGQVTFTTTNKHYLEVGVTFTISGVTPSGYNGTYTTIAGTGGQTLVAALAVNPGVETALGTVDAIAITGAKLNITYGAQISLAMKGNPQSIILALKTQGAKIANNSVFQVTDTNDNSIFSLKQDGLIFTNGTAVIADCTVATSGATMHILNGYIITMTGC